MIQQKQMEMVFSERERSLYVIGCAYHR